jgi:hypothetical protein
VAWLSRTGIGSRHPLIFRFRPTRDAERLVERDPFNREGKSCTETVLASTGSKMEVRELCVQENSTHDVTVHIETADSEHVEGTVKSNMSGGGHTMNMNGTFT